MIDVEIGSIVKNLGENVKFLQPLYESISNSLESGSSKIEIDLFSSEVLSEDMIPTMVGFSITDNGEGFTKDNIKSFCTLWSNHKMELGCRGSGRFTWLTVFNQIDIISYVKDEKTIVKIPFSMDFDREKIETRACDTISQTSTTITFRYVTSKYYRTSGKKKLDKRVLVDVKEIKKSIVDYLFLKLSFFFDINPQAIITIFGNGEKEFIQKTDINQLETIRFSIRDDFEGDNHDFELKYVFIKDNLNNKDFILCSNRRSGHKIQPSSINIYDRLPNNDSFMFFVTSDYLDKIDTDSRNGLDEYSSLKTVDILHSISYSKLLKEISIVVNRLVLEKYETIKESNKAIIEEVKNEAPYLSKYIDDIPLTIASKKAVKSEANKAFAEDKIATSERFESAFKNRHLDSDGFAEAVKDVSSVSAAELCEYIVYRSKILKALSTESLQDKKEKYLHDIFMPRKASSQNNDYLETNLWIMDDKFMSFVYASSDLSFLKINKELNGDNQRSQHDRRRPDMFIAFDKNSGERNAILVEFKTYNAPLDEKNKALTELPNNIGELRRTRKDIKTIWAYIITNIDDDFLESINDQPGYKPIYTQSNKGKIFHAYNDKTDAHIYISDIDCIVGDANSRNKVFLDILKIQNN